MSDIECKFFDREETHPDCTVQVLTNTVTGDVSVGWWKNEWIDVNERLPQDFEPCLVWYEYYHFKRKKVLPEYGIGAYLKGLKMWGGDPSTGRDVKVLYWRPLPEVPEEWRADNE